MKYFKKTLKTHAVFVHYFTFKIHQEGRIEHVAGRYWPAGRMFDTLALTKHFVLTKYSLTPDQRTCVFCFT